jgi:hypothetical protein
MFANTSSNFCLALIIFLLSIQSTLTLLCYECNNCTDIPTCTCDHTVDIDGEHSYCILLRETFTTGGVNIEIKHFPKNRTSYYIYDPYYISVRETIAYNDITERWETTSNEITYACHVDYCNKADLLKELPSNGLSLMLPTDWLSETLQRKVDGDPTLCRECTVEKVCGESPETMNISKICQRHDCQGSCYIEGIFEEAETSQFCYTSACPDDISVKLPKVFINGIYYINKNQFEIVDIFVTCNANDCSHLHLFQDIKDKLQKNLNNIKPFLPGNYVNSIYSTSIIFLIMILSLQMFIFY